MTSEQLDPRGPERLEAFSDGVFAIAITLLVLEIHIPSVEGATTPSALAEALLAQWPSLDQSPQSLPARRAR
jgi:uncharacterized membrane protein